MAVIALVGLGPRLRNVRFTQSVRGIESSIVSEFGSSASGQNARLDNFVCTATGGAGSYPLIAVATPGNTTVPGGSKDCVINGVMILFRDSAFEFYSIVSLREPVNTGVVCATASTFETVRDCYKARVARGTVPFQSVLTEPPERRVYSYQNGVKAESSIQNDGKPFAFGSIQNPNGTDRYQFFHLDGANAGFMQPQLSSSNTAGVVSKPYVCVKLAGRSAKISFSVDSTKPTVTYESCTI